MVLRVGKDKYGLEADKGGRELRRRKNGWRYGWLGWNGMGWTGLVGGRVDIVIFCVYLGKGGSNHRVG